MSRRSHLEMDHVSSVYLVSTHRTHLALLVQLYAGPSFCQEPNSMGISGSFAHSVIELS